MGSELVGVHVLGSESRFLVWWVKYAYSYLHHKEVSSRKHCYPWKRAGGCHDLLEKDRMLSLEKVVPMFSMAIWVFLQQIISKIA